jgi:hypothetical protein
MSPEHILSWLTSHRAMMSFETFGVVLYVAGYHYVEGETPAQAIAAMQRQMSVISAVIDHTLLLLPEARERESVA